MNEKNMIANENEEPVATFDASDDDSSQEFEGRKGGERKEIDMTKDLEELEEKIIFVNRVASVVKGGRRFSFSVLVAVGNRKGCVGIGLGKAKEVPEAVRKGLEVAKKSLVRVDMRGPTIPHEIQCKFGGAKVFMRPAPAGNGVIAGGAVRPIIELAGIKDIWTKSLGSSNSINTAQATLRCLQGLRSISEVAALRGKSEKELKYW